jgi:hypothetical protein
MNGSDFVFPGKYQIVIGCSGIHGNFDWVTKRTNHKQAKNKKMEEEGGKHGF